MKITSIIILLLMGMAVLCAYAIHAITLTPEDSLPLPPRLTREDIRAIESYLDVQFPNTTIKIYSYYDSFDRYHLYIRADITGDINIFMKDRNRVNFEMIDEIKKDLYVWPVKRYYANRISHGGGEILDWWQPDRNKIKWYCEESEFYQNSTEKVTDTTFLLEEYDGGWNVYIIKSRWPDSPREIEKVFPGDKVNWYLRESELYPIK